MIHISLFSGIGGFELAAEWMGWRNLVSCDINEFGNKVRKYYWPDGYCHTDIKTLTYETINNELSTRFGHGWRDDDIIITGGFPCQPYSSAGKRLGKDDQRHLWPEMLRVISEVKPTFIVGENVRGLTNWNGGVVFEEVCADLENLGYEVQPVLLSASGIGAPHHRMRVWFVAYSANNGYKNRCEETGRKKQCCEQRRMQQSERVGRERTITDSDSDGFNQCNCEHEIDSSEGREYAFGNIEQGNGDGNAADTSNERLEQTGRFIELSNKKRNVGKKGNQSSINITSSNSEYDAADTDSGRQSSEKYWEKKSGFFAKEGISRNWQNFPTQSPVCGGDDGLPTRLDNITFPKWRNESIKAYGNAIVPQVVYQIFKSLHHLQSEKD